MTRKCVVVANAGSKGLHIAFICFHFSLGSGLFANRYVRIGQEVTRFVLPNFVSSKECGKNLANQQEWWDCFSVLNNLPLDNAIFWNDAIIYDFCPPGEGNVWFFINHSSHKFNVVPVWTGKNLLFRAVRPIKKGQEIMFCYNKHVPLPKEWVA